MAKIVSAAGAAIVRDEQIAVIHRPRYDDWCLPKGKAETGELTQVTAVRECAEETGLAIRLGTPLGRWTYPIGRATKQVDWWRGIVVGELGALTDADEVDQVQWWPLERAVNQLSYRQEREVARLAACQQDTNALVILRHGKAIERKLWEGLDGPRPLADVGFAQSIDLIPLLHAWGVQRVVSSAWTRCTTTVAPYAAHYLLPVEPLDSLTEDAADADPAGAATTMARLIADCAATTPLVVCGHRPVLPLMLEAAGIAEHGLKPADAVVAHLTKDGETAAVEFHHQRD